LLISLHRKEINNLKSLKVRKWGPGKNLEKFENFSGFFPGDSFGDLLFFCLFSYRQFYKMTGMIIL